MTTSDSITLPAKYQVSDLEARNWFISFVCFAIIYHSMLLWGMLLKNYVDEGMGREIGSSLFFLLIISMVFLARDMFPVLAKIIGEIYWEIFVWPKEHEKAWAERFERESEERKQKFLDSLKKKEERRRKKNMKAVGEPIDLKQWVGNRSYWQGGYIYILKDTEISGYYKIGKTKQPHERMKAFGVLLPFAAELTHVIKCDSADLVEAHLHRHFSSKRQKGEWFALTDEDIAELKLIHEWK